MANLSGAVIQSTQYYPFGMAYAESTNQGAQPYKYNAKELDQDHGLNWYDYSARYLTNDVPRFTTVDPLAEKFYSWSPYVYNNPMKFIDPDGRMPWVAIPIIISLLLSADAVVAPTGNASDATNVQEARDSYNMGVLTSLVPIPGAAVSGSITKSVAAQTVKEGAQVIEKQVIKVLKEEVKESLDNKTVGTSRHARREAMRDQKIPTSQQPESQSKNASGREYTYKVSREGGSTQSKSVQEQTKDRSHKNEPHWEAGKTKVDEFGNVIYNNYYNRPKLSNEKSKVNY